jgi:small subunit ribosomal protein S16
MLAIRLQRTGRKGHAQFRLIVQEARRSPKSGAVVASLGNYDPHSKQASIDKEKAAFYLNNGAQPSDRVAVLLNKEGVKLPAWVKVDATKQAAVRNADKRRSTRPVEETEVPAVAETEVVETAEAPAAEANASTTE